MKKNLLSSPSNLFKILQPKSNGFLYTLFLVFCLGLSYKSFAQCTGPYARFESFAASGTNPATATASPSFTTFSTATVAFGSSAAARSGKFFCQTLGNGGWLMTPAISYAKTFSFYIKTTTSPKGPVSFTVEYSTDNFVTPINISTVFGVTLPAAATTTYQLVSVTLPYINSTNIKFKITDTNARAGSLALASPPSTYFGQLQIDDISWDTYTSSGGTSTGFPENTVVAPVSDGSANGCTGTTVVLDTSPGGTYNSAASYNFYDNGGGAVGIAGDDYNPNQINQVTFKPTGAGYTSGDRIRIQLHN